MLIRPEPAKALGARDEADLLRTAIARSPAVPGLRVRLARLLHQLDVFDDAIAVLTAPAAPPLDAGGELVLAAALFARDAPGDPDAAAAAATRALMLARTAADRAAALADQARALLRRDRAGEARALLHEALRLDPANRDACRRLAIDLLGAGEGAAALALIDDLAARGVAHTRLLTVRTLALAQLGRIDEACATADPGGFHHAQPLAPPAGWDDMDAFNDALAAELGAHPDMRYERHGTASRRTWRIDAPATGTAPLARALLEQIAAAAGRHAATLEGIAHPWCAARPAAGVLHSWCVITEGDGFETWHAHPAGWMSGTYYVQVPREVAAGDDRGGCIAFGLPDGAIGRDAAARFGEHRVRPQAGMLLLFPSHNYHRTYPHGAAARRICVSFDIRPG